MQLHKYMLLNHASLSMKKTGKDELGQDIMLALHDAGGLTGGPHTKVIY